MTSHISPECALNPNAPIFVCQSADNYVLHSSPGLQTSTDMITNTVSEYEHIKWLFHSQHRRAITWHRSYSFCFSPSKTKLRLTLKSMTSNLTKTDGDDSDDEIPYCKHCDIWYCSLLLITPCVQYLRSWCRRPI